MVIGLDLSLTASGLVLLDEGYKIVLGEKLSIPQTGTERLFHLENLFLSYIDNIDIKFACIEAPAYKAEGNLYHMGEWSGIVKLNLFKKGIPIIEAAPSQLKKFAIGKGTGPKSVVIKEVYKNFNEDFNDDNICDAYVLSRISKDFYDKYILKKEIDLPKYQLEVLKNINKNYGPKLNVLI